MVPWRLCGSFILIQHVSFQVLVGVDAVVAGVIIYTDKTALTHDMKLQGWPICLTLGNIPRHLRGQPHGHVVVGMLPDVITNNTVKGYIRDNVQRMRVFHKCMNLVVESLKTSALRYVFRNTLVRSILFPSHANTNKTILPGHAGALMWWHTTVKSWRSTHCCLRWSGTTWSLAWHRVPTKHGMQRDHVLVARWSENIFVR